MIQPTADNGIKTLVAAALGARQLWHRVQRTIAVLDPAGNLGPFQSVVFGTNTALTLNFHFCDSAIAAAACCLTVRMLGVHFNMNILASHPVSHADATAKRGSTSEKDV